MAQTTHGMATIMQTSSCGGGLPDCGTLRPCATSENLSGDDHGHGSVGGSADSVPAVSNSSRVYIGSTGDEFETKALGTVLVTEPGTNSQNSLADANHSSYGVVSGNTP